MPQKIAVIDPELCVKCGGCVSGYDGTRGCKNQALQLHHLHGPMVIGYRCTGCGACVALCGLGAISLEERA